MPVEPVGLLFQEEITPVSPSQSQSVTFQKSEARDLKCSQDMSQSMPILVTSQLTNNPPLRLYRRPHQLYLRLRPELRPCLVGKPHEIPSKFALIEYVLECASDVGFCMKPPKTIGDSQKNDTFLLCMLARFVVCAWCLLRGGCFFTVRSTMNGCAHKVG